MRKKELIVFCLIFLFVLFCNVLKASITLKKVMTIGSDKPHYEFFRIDEVEVDDYGNIYVPDFKGCFIRKYSQDGKFIAETGRCGQGPGEFLSVDELCLGDDKVYAYDLRSRRITIYGKELKGKAQFIKLKKGEAYSNIFYMNGLFYFVKSLSLNPDRADYDKRILAAKINESGIKPVCEFFNHFPDYYKKGKKDKMELAMLLGYTILETGYSKKRKEIVSVFKYPGKKLVFYYYSSKGKFLRKHSIELLKGYKLPKFLLEFPLKYPKKWRNILVDSIHWYKDKYILTHYIVGDYKKKREMKRKDYLLVVNASDGKVVNKIIIDEGMRIFRVSGDYLYAKNFNDDIEKLHIFKIEGIK